MLLIKPSSEILKVSEDALGLIELAGRTCYKSEDKITTDSAAKFSAGLLKRGHESVVEHSLMTVRFVCDRGVSHEIVRHRLASFSQESTRYCDYDRRGLTFILPPWVDIAEGEYSHSHTGTSGMCATDRAWFCSVFDSAQTYKYMVQMGWKPEMARSVLPNSLKTEVVMSANFREWRHFFDLRTAAAAHPQMRELARPLLEVVRSRVPVIFDDCGVTE